MDKIISKEAIGELQKALVPVVTKLGQGGEWVYRTYYKQQIVIGVQNLVGALIGFVVLIIAWRVFPTVKKESKGDLWFLWGIFILIGVVVFIGFGIEAIGRLINPDYYLLQDLLSIIKK